MTICKCIAQWAGQPSPNNADHLSKKCQPKQFQWPMLHIMNWPSQEQIQKYLGEMPGCFYGADLRYEQLPHIRRQRMRITRSFIEPVDMPQFNMFTAFLCQLQSTLFEITTISISNHDVSSPFHTTCHKIATERAVISGKTLNYDRGRNSKGKSHCCKA